MRAGVVAGVIRAGDPEAICGRFVVGQIRRLVALPRVQRLPTRGAPRRGSARRRHTRRARSPARSTDDGDEPSSDVVLTLARNSRRRSSTSHMRSGAHSLIPKAFSRSPCSDACSRRVMHPAGSEPSRSPMASRSASLPTSSCQMAETSHAASSIDSQTRGSHRPIRLVSPEVRRSPTGWVSGPVTGRPCRSLARHPPMQLRGA